MKDKRIKVLEISSYPPPMAGWGMRVYILKREMEAQGHLCTVLNIGKGRFLKGRDYEPVLSGFDYVKKVLRYRLKGYLVHMHLNGDSPKGLVLSVLALSISLLTLQRPVITFHAGPVQKYFPHSEAPLLTPVWKFIFGVPRHIICNSDVEKQAIMTYGVPERKFAPIQAFTRQYLEFDRTSLPEKIDAFYARYPHVICTYLFYRPQFFVEEMMSAFAKLVEDRSDTGLIVMGPDRDLEPIESLIRQHKLEAHVLIAGNQAHDDFLTIMSRSKMYLRTQVKDGVCSSVLESLALGTPVVAVENGTRPPSVVTYENKNIQDMVDKMNSVLDDHDGAVAAIVKPDIPDTVTDEIAVLAG